MDQRTIESQQVWEIFTRLGWLVGVALVIIVIAVAVYRRVSASGNSSTYTPTFSLSDLRHLRDEGRITEQEYERARAKVIGQSTTPPHDGDHTAHADAPVDKPDHGQVYPKETVAIAERDAKRPDPSPAIDSDNSGHEPPPSHR